MGNSKTVGNTSAARITASSIGVVAGLGGMEHGLFEFLQGNIRPDGMVMNAIGPAQRLWEYGNEPGFTLIPNFFITSILAMTAGFLVIIWSIAFINRKHSAWVLAFLSIIMFLVGGGFSPPVFAILAIIAASKIDKPLPWWRRHLSQKVQTGLSRLWRWVLIALVSLSTLLLIQAIFGYPLLWFIGAEGTLTFNSLVGYITFFVLGPVVIAAAFAYDIRKQSASETPPGNLA